MKFFNLTRKEYKKYTEQFKETYIGGRLYLMFSVILGLLLFNILCEIATFFTNGETFKYTIIYNLLDINSALILIGTIIVYFTYFKYLKEYIENSVKAKK